MKKRADQIETSAGRRSAGAVNLRCRSVEARFGAVLVWAMLGVLLSLLPCAFAAVPRDQGDLQGPRRGSFELLGLCRDLDGDGFGALGGPACPAGPVADCNDADPRSFPGADEICDDVDNDCDLRIDEPTIGTLPDGTLWAVPCNRFERKPGPRRSPPIR